MVPQTLLVDPDGRGRGKGPILVDCDFVTNATKGGLISESSFISKKIVLSHYLKLYPPTDDTLRIVI